MPKKPTNEELEQKIVEPNNQMVRPKCIVDLHKDQTELQVGLALHSNEKDLRLIQEIAKIGVWSWEIVTNRAEWSDQVYEIFKAPRKRPSYEFARSFVHPGDLHLWEATILQAFEKQAPFVMDYRAIQGDDKMIWVHNESQTIFNEQGEFIGYQGVVQDITERKQAEEALRQQAQLLHLSYDAILVWRKDGGIEHWNRGAEQLYGFTESEVLGRVTHKLLKTIHPVPWLEIEAAMRKHGQWEGELRHHAKDGHEVTVSARHQLVLGTDGIERILETNRDITERNKAGAALRESEERFHRLFEDDLTGNFVCTPKGKILLCNPAFSAIFGFFSPEAAVGTSMLELYVDPAERNSMLKSLKKQGKLEWYEAWRKRLDGKSIYVVENLVGHFKDRGELYEIQGYIFDDTNRKLAEEERRRTQEALQGLNKTLEQQVVERSELAQARAKQLQALAVKLIETEERERQRIAQLLHDDLQQILAAARMQLQWASERLPSEPRLAYVVKLLEESTEKTRSLSHELSPSVVQHADLVTALKWIAENMLKQFGLHVQLKAGSVPKIENFPTKMFLFRSAQELLFNVAKHAGVKSVQVVCSGSENSVSIEICDEGKGFNPAILDSAKAPAGLGLRSLRERANYIGGSLAIESSPGQGSRFTLTVPLDPKKADKLHKLESGQEFISAGERNGGVDKKRIRVLFADDHEVMRQGLVSMVGQQPDIQVVGEAVNGKEAIELVRQLKPDVAVLDFSMPEMDGIEATRRIKAEFPEVRVIGLTMYANEQQVVQAMIQAGAEAVVNKTASLSELLGAIYANRMDPD